MIALVTIGGCGPKHNSRAAAVDPKIAESTLVTTLDAWKSGKKPEDLAGLQPKIVVQDMDWKLGSRLSDYKVTGNSTPRDANLIAEVQLTLVNDKGKESKKTVKYIVGTDPVLTVFRQMMD